MRDYNCPYKNKCERHEPEGLYCCLYSICRRKRKFEIVEEVWRGKGVESIIEEIGDKTGDKRNA